MEEFGQPMHAYDLDTIANQEIVVRRAGKDEKFVTLDGQERIMDENVLMICDGEKLSASQVSWGGENSMITDDVKTVLLRRRASMEPASVFLPRGSDFVQMHPVNLRRVLTRTMHKLQLTVHAS